MNGRQAISFQISKKETADAIRTVDAVRELIDRAKVFQGGGNERYELTLVAKVEAAARASLDRLFPNFKDADDNRWSSVINRAKGGRSKLPSMEISLSVNLTFSIVRGAPLVIFVNSCQSLVIFNLKLIIFI